MAPRSNLDASRKSIPAVHVAMIGARRHYAVPLLFHRAGMLEKFFTDVYIGDKPWTKRLLNGLSRKVMPAALGRLLGRECEGLPPENVVSFDALGLKTFWLLQRVKSSSELNEVYAATNGEFARKVVQHGIEGADAIYGFNGASLEIFQEAKSRGISCILDQVSAPMSVENRLIREELDRWPDWEPGLKVEPEGQYLQEREESEWELADRILCASAFVTENLGDMGVDKEKCQVLPYSIDIGSFHPAPPSEECQGLNVLFVGRVGLQKGVPYLFEALRKLNSCRIQCRIVGEVGIEADRLNEFSRWIEITGPVPRNQILEFFHWANVLVFPSICDGFGMVQIEAMACGLPVIATPNCGTVVRNEEDGLIVPIRDVESLASALERFLTDREFLRHCQKNVIARRESLGLESYGKRLVKAVSSLDFSTRSGPK